MKRNKITIAIPVAVIAIVIAIAISSGFGRSKVLMEIEAYEREEAAIKSTIKPTPLDTAKSEMQDCFAKNKGHNKSVCMPYLEKMDNAAKEEATREVNPIEGTPTTESSLYSSPKNTDTKETTPLDTAISKAQDCFAQNRGDNQFICIPYLKKMEEVARTGR